MTSTSLTAISPSTGAGAAAGARSPESATGPTFSAALSSQQQLDAARGVLATLPAPIVYSLRDQAGSPVEAVDRLFEVLRDGSFTPPDGPLGSPDSIIGATAHATTVFETPAQLWATLRASLADPASLASTFRAVPAPAPEPALATPPEVRTLEDAERLLAGIRPGSPPLLHLDWWEAALRFLLGANFPA